MDSQGIFPENSLSELRQSIFGQRGYVIWFFGRSGSGKSTIARAVDERLLREGKKTVWLDGDRFRQGVSRDLGFSEHARDENLRRAAEVAKILLESEMIVICSFISPLKKHRDLVKSILGSRGRLIYINASIDICRQRDPKGLYKQAQLNSLQNSVEMFEVPTQEEDGILSIDNDGQIPQRDNFDQIIDQISLAFD